MNKITDIFKKKKVLISDGAWGTFLQQKGLRAGECPELWNVEHRQEVLDIARSYAGAGADIIGTNSFGGSRIKLESYGQEERATELNKAAAEISREAAGTYKYVAGSMGPTGKLLMTGDVTADGLYHAFREQAVALAAGGADALLIETMSDLEEAGIAIKAARENTSCDVFCTMTFEQTVPGGFHTMMGVTPADMVSALVEAGASVIGANCGSGMEDMIGIVKEIRAANRDIPVLVQANAGLPVLESGNAVYRETPEMMKRFVPELIKAGASIIGGCCGTTPRHIEDIAGMIKGAEGI